jgi:hypothetical protein
VHAGKKNDEICMSLHVRPTFMQMAIINNFLLSMQTLDLVILSVQMVIDWMTDG